MDRLLRALRSLRRRPLSTVLLGLVAAILSWPLEFGSPEPYLDPSWGAGLAIAAREQMQWGTEIVYTYGPLGFIRDTRLWFDGQAVLAYVYGSIIHVALACALVAALRRWLGAAVALVIAVAALAVLHEPEKALVLALVAGYAVLSGRPIPPRLLWAGIGCLALLAAIETLAKVTIGPTIAFIAVVSLAAGLGRRPATAFGAAYAVSLLALWVAAGQEVPAIPDFVANTARVVAGHGEAMTLRVVPRWWEAGAGLAVLALIAASARLDYRDRGARIAGVAIAAVVGFIVYRQAAIRFDEPHLGLFFATAALFWLALPWRPSLRLPAIAGAVLLGSMSLHVFDPRGLEALNFAANVGRAGEGVRDLVNPSRRDAIRAEAAREMQAGYAIEPEVLAALEGHSVAVEPSEVSAVWAYGLDWQPLPVFVSNTAYTPTLDDLNANATAEITGPERILRENTAAVDPIFPSGAIDGRYRGWESPAQQRAMLCQFAPEVTAPRWQVLRRVGDRCGEPRLVESVDAEYGEQVQVPPPPRGDVVFVRVEGAGVAGLEKLRAFLYAPGIHYAVLNDTTGYRLVRATASQGLLLRGPPSLGSGPYAQLPQASSIELTGGEGSLRFDFYAMELRPAIPRAAPRS